MKAIERRLDRLEWQLPVPPCSHGLAVLHDPTDEEIESVQKQLDDCPQCGKNSTRPNLIIFTTYKSPEGELSAQAEQTPTAGGSFHLTFRGD